MTQSAGLARGGHGLWRREKVVNICSELLEAQRNCSDGRLGGGRQPGVRAAGLRGSGGAVAASWLAADKDGAAIVAMVVMLRVMVITMMIKEVLGSYWSCC